MPVVCNPRNQEGWPDVVSREVMENLHKFVANTYVTVGMTQGKTMLPLPPADTTAETSITNMSDKDKVSDARCLATADNRRHQAVPFPFPGTFIHETDVARE